MKLPNLLKITEIKSQLKLLPDWRYLPKNKTIQAKYKTKGFTKAAQCIQEISKMANQMDHHPDIHLTKYRYLTIVLTTHDAGGVTKKDIDFAMRIDPFVKKYLQSQG